MANTKGSRCRGRKSKPGRQRESPISTDAVLEAQVSKTLLEDLGETGKT